MKVLLDTNVVSELVTKSPDASVIAWIDAQDVDQTYLSAITVGELQRGILRLIASKRRDRLESWLRDDLLLRFEGKIMPVDAGVMLTWGKLTASLEAAGRTLPAWDSLIAAQALHFRCALATRNTRDFAGCGISLIDPWTGSAATS